MIIPQTVALLGGHYGAIKRQDRAEGSGSLGQAFGPELLSAYRTAIIRLGLCPMLPTW